jgi:hypothetical protein
MASTADVDLQLGTGAARDKRVATAALDLSDEIFGMDVVFHSFHLDHCRPPGKRALGNPTTGDFSKKAN